MSTICNEGLMLGFMLMSMPYVERFISFFCVFLCCFLALMFALSRVVGFTKQSVSPLRLSHTRAID